MMITGATPCYSDHQNHCIFGVSDHDVLSSSLDPTTSSSNPTSFLYNLSLLKDKILQVQSLATISFDHAHHHESTPIALPTMATLIQEIVVTASSMMFSCQQMSLGTSQATNTAGGGQHNGGGAAVERASSGFFINHQDTVDQWYGDGYNRDSSEDHNHGSSRTEGVCEKFSEKIGRNIEGVSMNNMQDIVELEAADLLAKYTHYCQVCGKGFKRDANLRMHMRAHGDKYKSSAALSNPTKVAQSVSREKRKYSCPQEGCRWNKNHVKFQPLKSMICVKNHYKRSHCPKMYVCKRCNTKQFSVLSDLRTHEKHCGDLKGLCSCGTTFSRKDKLMGHVALFVGHMPVINSSMKTGKNGARNMH